VNPSQIVRTLASVRIPSSYGPEIDYEIVQAVVRSDADPHLTREAVLFRIVVGDQPRNDRAAEILVQDLPAVQAHWTRFVQDVLWRRAQAGDPGAQTALKTAPPPPAPPPPEIPQISASGGRFGRSTGEAPFIPAKKEKKRSEPFISAGPRGKALPAPPPYEEAAFEEPKVPVVPEHVEVIRFNLSSPPGADGLMKPIQAKPNHLLIVTPMALAPKVLEYVEAVRSGKAQGPPTEFTPIFVRRSASGSVTNKKLRSQVAVGIAQMLGTLDRILWITAE
jgi:hypothetical protein